MKKLLIACVIAGLSLAACGGRSNTSTTATKAKSTQPGDGQAAPVPPGMAITTIQQLRDRSSVIVLATVTGDTAPDTSTSSQSDAGAENTPVRVDRTVWGSMPALSSGTFTLTRYFSDPNPLVVGQQYLMFLKMGGPGTAGGYVIPNQIFGIDGSDYVNDSQNSWFPGRRDRAQTDQQISG